MKSNTGKYIKAAVFVWSGCFIVFLLVFMTVLSPLKKRRTLIETEYTKIKANADDAKLAAQEQTKIWLNERIENLNKSLGDFVIRPGSISNLTYEISGISNEIGLNTFQVSPTGQSVTALDNCKYVSGQLYQVGFTASFNQFAAFLNALERYRPVIFVDTFSIARSRQGDTDHKVGMQLAVLVAKNEKS